MSNIQDYNFKSSDRTCFDIRGQENESMKTSFDLDLALVIIVHSYLSKIIAEVAVFQQQCSAQKMS